LPVQPGRDGKPARSLQFFDANGTAVHKIYLRNEPGVAVYDKLVATCAAAERGIERAGRGAEGGGKPDSEIDVSEFQLAWKDMTDVRPVAQIMREFHLSREQALRLAPAGVVERVTPEALRTLLENAAKNKVAIMVFLGNEGLTQISGKIENHTAGGFFNVLDPDFNLHIRDTALRSGWVVKRAASPPSNSSITKARKWSPSSACASGASRSRKRWTWPTPCQSRGTLHCCRPAYRRGNSAAGAACHEEHHYAADPGSRSCLRAGFLKRGNHGNHHGEWPQHSLRKPRQPDDPCVLLVMGGHAADRLARGLRRRHRRAGLSVVRFDNRDSGLSSKMALAGKPYLPLAYVKTCWAGP
jgi:hypothetical protein